jgi:ATP-dependent helicase HrpA
MGFLNLDEAAYRFYAARLLPDLQSPDPDPRPPVSSVGELVDLVRERRGAEPRFLIMEADDLRDPNAIEVDADAYPEALPIENRALPLAYAYKPGQPDDGVTLDVHVREAGALTPAALDWAVPGHLEPKVEHYLRALPKELRRAFVPLAETARSLAQQIAQRDRLTGRRETLTESLAAQIAERFRVSVDPAVWNEKPLPDHLRVRIRVVDDRGRELCASRDLAGIEAALHAEKREASTAVARAEPDAWRRARQRWEKSDATEWSFGDVPARVLVTEQAGVPVFAFPALKPGNDGVSLRLFKTPEEAAGSMRRGLEALLELQLRYDLGWLQRDLRAMRDLGPLVSTLAPLPELQDDAFVTVRRWICDPARIAGRASPPGEPERSASDAANSRLGEDSSPSLTERTFAAAVEKAKTDLRGLVPRFIDLLREILSLRQALLVHPTPPAGLERDLAALLPPHFLRTTPYPQLTHFPRYLKAMKQRAERWRQHPPKDAERAAQLAPYVSAVALFRDRPGGEALRWLVEEFRVSLFAQELGTAEPVSTVKLDRLVAAIQAGTPIRPDEPVSAPVMSPAAAAPKPVVAPKPIITAPVADKKSAPLKSLGALDKLFRRA